MNRTSIEWTDFSANPIKYRDASGKAVWGCIHASPGCQHCYAEVLAKRYGRGGPFNVQTLKALTPFLDEAECHKMRTYKPASGQRCFIGDMTDIFGEWVSDALLDELFAVLAFRGDVTWQVLTKRADRMRDYFRSRETSADYWKQAARRQGLGLEWEGISLVRFPLPNVWLGVSAEDQLRVDQRLPVLLDTPAAVRFLSAEPLLGGLDIGKHRPGALGLSWVIVGGESGPGSRPCKTWWVRNIVGQCRDADVAVFVKQLGSNVEARNDDGFEGDPGDDWTPETRYEELTAQGWQGDPVRIRLRDRKGKDMAEWPQPLRVREFPLTGTAHPTRSVR